MSVTEFEVGFLSLAWSGIWARMPIIWLMVKKEWDPLPDQGEQIQGQRGLKLEDPVADKWQLSPCHSKRCLSFCVSSAGLRTLWAPDYEATSPIQKDNQSTGAGSSKVFVAFQLGLVYCLMHC